MEHCQNCGSCGNCSGCQRALLLSADELSLLQRFAQIPFLPVARKAGDTEPVYLEDGDPVKSALVIACLEKKGLIDIDYHMPLDRFDYSAYRDYPLHGSMALTARGQEALDTIDLQGVTEE